MLVVVEAGPVGPASSRPNPFARCADRTVSNGMFRPPAAVNGLTMTISTAPMASDLESAQALIDSWMAQLSSGLMSRRIVVDQLLDLRNLLNHERGALATIDDLLANVPGITVVEADWWNEELLRLQKMIDLIERNRR